MSNFHTPVLLQEVINYLPIVPGEKYIDATIGGGGHSREILNRGGLVLGLDIDQDAIDFVKENFKSQVSNLKLRLAHGNFRDIKSIANSQGFTNVSGILFDLGVSSYQLDSAQKGFSFNKEGPLDMRMDKNLGVTAKDLVHALSKQELTDLFLRFGEEKNGWRIAAEITKSRTQKPITTTKQLTEIIHRVVPKKYGDIDPATRVFQAFRIVVNDELDTIKQGLSQAVGLLRPTGRILIISFHSLEDRIVKQSFVDFERNRLGTILTKKPIIPSVEEITRNVRSRSAKLRVFEKN